MKAIFAKKKSKDGEIGDWGEETEEVLSSRNNWHANHVQDDEALVRDRHETYELQLNVCR